MIRRILSWGSKAWAFIFTVLVSAGFMHYGTLAGAGAVAMTFILSTVVFLLSLIPFLGAGFVIVAMYFLVFPYVFEMFGVESSYLQTVILGIFVLLSVVMTIYSSTFTIRKWREWRG